MQTRNSSVRTGVAYRNCGCATLTMTVVTIRMNLRTCAVNVIARLDGNVVLANRTIVAFRNGCSAMERTIVVTTATNYRKIVQLATRKPISSAPTIVAYQSKYQYRERIMNSESKIRYLMQTMDM